MTRSWEDAAEGLDEEVEEVGWSASGMRRRLRKKVRTSWTMEVSCAFILGCFERGSATRATITCDRGKEDA